MGRTRIGFPQRTVSPYERALFSKPVAPPTLHPTTRKEEEEEGTTTGKKKEENTATKKAGVDRHAPTSKRTVYRHQSVVAVLSVSPGGFTLTNGATSVSVDGPSNNSAIAREVKNMGVTSLLFPDQHSARRWGDVAESSDEPSFRKHFRTLTLRNVDLSQDRKCPSCKKHCHRFKAVPAATEAIFPEWCLAPIRHEVM